MISADFKEIRRRWPAGITPRHFVLPVVLLVCAMSLSGCMDRIRDEYVPGQATSGAGKAVTAEPRGDKIPSAGETDRVKPSEKIPENTVKNSIHQGVSPGVTDKGQASSGSAETGASAPESQAFPAEATVSYNGETITEDTEWRGKVIVRGSVTVAPQATVTVSPGTVVRFSRSAGGENTAVLLVRGRIAAGGTKDRPVKFLPTGDEPRSATWQGIMFLASEKNNILEHCRIEGAETGVDAAYSTVTVRDSIFSGCRTALRARDSRARISGCAASNCELGAGLYDSEAEIAGGTMVSNRTAIFAKGSSLYLTDTVMADNSKEALRAEESTVKVTGSKFGGNGDGLVLSACEGLVSGNRIAQNGGCGISLAGSRMQVTANDISQNGRIGIRVADGKGIAWGNIISANGQYDVYNAGAEDFRAIGNWWGAGSAPASPGKIFDRAVNPASGKVLCFPLLRDMPVVAP